MAYTKAGLGDCQPCATKFRRIAPAVFRGSGMAKLKPERRRKPRNSVNLLSTATTHVVAVATFATVNRSMFG